MACSRVTPSAAEGCRVGVGLGDLLKGGDGLGDGRRIERLQRGRRRAQQALDTGQSALLTAEGVVLAGNEAGLRDLVDLEAELVEEAFALARVGADGFDLAAQGAQLADLRGERVALLAQAAERVEDGELDGRAQQRELLGLAVDVDNASAELAEALGRRAVVTDAPGGASREAHGALNREPVVAGTHAGADAGALGAVRDDAAAVPASEEEVEGVDDDRLAGAGLAGDDVQAGTGGEGHVARDGEAGDGELLNHRCSWRC